MPATIIKERYYILTPLSFLSKAEVRTWPVAGWLGATGLLG